jgi:hypothetical protein
MADKSSEQQTSEIDPTKDRYAGGIDEPLPTADDPGGAHAKGYSAEAAPAPEVKDPVKVAR